MKFLKPTSIVVLTGLLCSTAFGSRERLIPTHKVSIWANAGKPFGEVNATIETTSSVRNPRIKSIVLTVGRKKFAVPQASFKNLQHPLITSAEFRTETGTRTGGSPWLYLMFLLDTPKTKSLTDFQRVYITFRDGGLRETHVWSNDP